VDTSGEQTALLMDTHCHLDMRQFDADRDAVIERAATAGVRTIINPAVDLASCRRVLALAEQHAGIYAAVGVHPNDCADFDDETAASLRELARQPKVVAIGEIGLDYYWEKVDHEQQKRALRTQLTLAAELNLPVILHCRNADGGDETCAADLLWEMEQWWPEIRKRRGEHAIFGVWHAFGGTLAQAQRAHELGLVLGLGGPVTFQNARRLHGVVPRLRIDRVVLETDAPYLTPHPHRGQRNEPAYVPLIATGLAQLFQTNPADIAARTSTTARQCFGDLISA
jgi:TatD DNase family protein